MKNLIFNRDNITRFLIMLAAVTAGYFVMHHDTPKNNNKNNDNIHEANFSEIIPIDDTTDNTHNKSK